MGRKPKDSRKLKIHFRRRWLLRYPDLGDPDIDAINSKIYHADQENARFVWSQSNVRKHWEVLVSGEWIPVVYDKRHKTVVTCLPPRT